LQLVKSLCPEQKIRYWCYDETRFGLKTIERRRITLSGVKAKGSVQWIRKAFWLYGAVDPMYGDAFFLKFSHLDANCFEYYLTQLSNAFPDYLNIMQMDSASAHTAGGITFPTNVIPWFQPPHCPELNPPERLWKFIKDDLAWHLFDDFEQLHSAVDAKLATLSPCMIISLCAFPFIVDALSVANL